MSYTIEKARPTDREAILAVMAPWNMHHVPSPEMEELDISCFFVARSGDKIIGASGYAIISQKLGKTTLLGVIPEYASKGVGGKLQKARLKAMFQIGVKKVITNADRPKTIGWYKKHYGYKKIGTLKKVCSFGDDSVDSWTTLEMDLEAYMKKEEATKWKKNYIKENEPFPLAPYPPLLINACLTGMIPTKEKTQYVPITPEEIIKDAINVCDAGAQIVHIHARDNDGKPTWKASIYEQIISGIRRERPKLICCVSLSGRNWPDFERRSEPLRLTGIAKPDMASLTLGSLNFPTGPSINSPDMIAQLAATMQELKILPELEAFNIGMVSYAKFLERRGLLPGSKKYINLLRYNSLRR